MTPRLHVPIPLAAGARLALPERAARHIQVLRLQPGDTVRLFDGVAARDWEARIERMGKRDVDATVVRAVDLPDRELQRAVVLAVGMPANDRMDALVEKATELGASGLVPLVTTRSVLRLDGPRAEARQRHWQGIAEAACEQCGRAIVPVVALPQSLAAFLRGHAPASGGWLLSLGPEAEPVSRAAESPPAGGRVLLSGPEGGLAPEEETAARTAGFLPVSLGPRTLRADTAPLALLAWLALQDRGTAA